MRRKITALITAAMLLPAAAGAQGYDPWPGYDARGIRDLREEAAARQERLRTLARESYERRAATSPYTGVSRLARPETPAVVSSARPPRPAQETALPSAAVPAPGGLTVSARPPQRVGPPWPGPALSLTDADRLWMASLFAPKPEPLIPEFPEGAVVTEVVYPDVVLTESARPTPRPVPSWPTAGLDLTQSGLFLASLPEGAAFRTGKKTLRHDVRIENGYAMLVPNLRALVDVSRQRVTLMEGEKVLAEWPVSTGRPGYETTRGKFKPTFLSRNHRSSQYNNAPMPCSVFFHKGEAFHGTTALGALGRKASHGCVRLETKNACALYDMVAARGKQALTVEVFD